MVLECVVEVALDEVEDGETGTTIHAGPVEELELLFPEATPQMPYAS